MKPITIIITILIIISSIFWWVFVTMARKWSSQDEGHLIQSLNMFIERKGVEKTSVLLTIRHCMQNRITNNFSGRQFTRMNSTQVTDLFNDTYRSCVVRTQNE